jgi:regulator of replication initiation timing
MEQVAALKRDKSAAKKEAAAMQGEMPAPSAILRRLSHVLALGRACSLAETLGALNAEKSRLSQDVAALAAQRSETQSRLHGALAENEQLRAQAAVVNVVEFEAMHREVGRLIAENQDLNVRIQHVSACLFRCVESSIVHAL